MHVCASSKVVLASKLVLASIMVLTSLYIGPDLHLLWCAKQTLKRSLALNVNICKPNTFSTYNHIAMTRAICVRASAHTRVRVCFVGLG